MMKGRDALRIFRLY